MYTLYKFPSKTQKQCVVLIQVSKYTIDGYKNL